MNTSRTSIALRWARRLLPALAICASQANAGVYSGVWDPTYGSPFANLGWRGTAEYFVPNSCEPTGTADVNNATACSGGAIVTAAQVEFYDTTDTGQSTISTMVFNATSMIIGTLRFVSGDLTQLTTSGASYVDPVENLSAFGVGADTEFSLFFTLDGPRLGWRNCGYENYRSSSYYEPECSFGVNDAQQFPATFSITRVPEPGSLALVCLALIGLASRRFVGTTGRG